MFNEGCLDFIKLLLSPKNQHDIESPLIFNTTNINNNIKCVKIKHEYYFIGYVNKKEIDFIKFYKHDIGMISKVFIDQKRFRNHPNISLFDENGKNYNSNETIKYIQHSNVFDINCGYSLFYNKENIKNEYIEKMEPVLIPIDLVNITTDYFIYCEQFIIMNEKIKSDIKDIL